MISSWSEDGSAPADVTLAQSFAISTRVVKIFRSRQINDLHQWISSATIRMDLCEHKSSLAKLLFDQVCDTDGDDDVLLQTGVTR